VYDKAPEDSRTPMVTAPDDLIFANVSAWADAITPKPNNAATKRFFFITAPSLLLKRTENKPNQAKSRIYSF
jgi:hypothetical protein